MKSLHQPMSSQKDYRLSFEKLEQHSKVELIKMVLQQQIQLRTLQVVLHHLENQMSGSETEPLPSKRADWWKCPVSYLLSEKHQTSEVIQRGQSPYNDNIEVDNLFPPACANVMVDIGLQDELKQLAEIFLTERQQKIDKAVRSALRQLDDVTYLEQSSLIELIAKVRQIQLDGRGLQQALYQAIERSKPVDDQPGWSRQQLRYDILRLTYQEKMKPSLVAATLSISERQYYRELKTAIRTVIEYLVNS